MRRLPFYFLLAAVHTHPNMRGVVAREVCAWFPANFRDGWQINQFMKSPKSTKRIQWATTATHHSLIAARYRCVTVLNQTELRASESALAEQLINIYFDFFKACAAVRCAMLADTPTG